MKFIQQLTVFALGLVALVSAVDPVAFCSSHGGLVSDPEVSPYWFICSDCTIWPNVENPTTEY